MNNIESLKTLIRTAGLKSTPPRIAVLKALSKTHMPLSHGDLVSQLAADGFDRATIFRNLNDMATAGLLSRIDIGDHTWRFEIKNNPSSNLSHPHFVCTDCGDVSCLTEMEFQMPSKQLKNNSKVGNISEVLLKGHCEDCED